MTLDESFLLAIREEPDDDTPRLVYADWLMEQEELWRAERGEFIRLQCELVRMPENHPGREEKQQRERALLQRNWEAWIGPFRRLLRSGSQDGWIRGNFKIEAVSKFRRGFVEALSLHARTFLDVAEDLIRLTPLRRLELLRAGSLAEHLASCRVLDGIQRLWFGDYFVDPLDSNGVRALVESPFLRRLSFLSLLRNNVADAGATYLAHSRNLPELRRLELAHNGISTEGLRALAGSSLLSQLMYLGLEGNEITAEGRGLLLASPHLSDSAILRLDGNGRSGFPA